MSELDQPATALGPDNPWPGLNQFAEAHDNYFRGRDEEKAELFRLVKSATLTTLFGRSGLGKSSLLRAGLFPLLRQAGYLPVVIHLRHDAGGDEAPPLISQVFTALQEACAAGQIEMPEVRSGETLWEYFHRAEAGFWNERNRLVTPVLVFDQFEEAFTLGIENSARRARRDTFFTELEELIENRPPLALRERWDRDPELIAQFDGDRTGCKIVLSLREDFLPDLEQFKDRIRSIMQNRFRLERMDGQKAWQVVTGEMLVEGQPRRTLSYLVDEEVALQIIDFVSRTRTQRDATPPSRETLRTRTVDPALLSVVCSELNHRRRAQGQAKISFTLLSQSKDEIIREFFDSHVRALGPAAGAVRRFIEEELITSGEGYRKRYALEEESLRQKGVAATDLRRLEDQRILRFEPSEGITWIELTHDLLTGVVRASRRERLALEDHARANAERWEKKRKTARVAAMVMLTAGLLVLGFLWNKARLATASAEQQRNHAETQTAAAKEERQKAYKYGIEATAERIQVSFSEQPPNLPRARLIAEAAKEIGWFPYDATIEMFAAPPLFAPKTTLRFRSEIARADYTPDGRWLATLDTVGRLLFTALDRSVSPDEGGEEIHRGVASFAFFPSGKPLVALRLREKEEAVLFNYETRQQVGVITWKSSAPAPGKRAQGALPAIALSAAGDLLAAAASDGSVHVFGVGEIDPKGSAASPQELVVTRTAGRNAVSFEQDAGDLPSAPATELGFIKIGDVQQLVAVNPDGIWVWPNENFPSTGFTHPLSFEQLVSRTSKESGEGELAKFAGLGVGAFGQVLCLAPYDDVQGAVCFRDQEAWPQSARRIDRSALNLPAHTTTAACSPDGQLVAIGTATGGVYLFRGDEMLQRLEHPNAIRAISFRADGQALAVAAGRRVRLWRLSRSSGDALSRAPVFTEAAALSPAGQWLATKTDEQITLRDAASGVVLRATATPAGEFRGLAVNDDAEVFALLLHEENTVRREVFSGKESARWTSATDGTLSPDGRWVVAGSGGNFAVTNPATGETKMVAASDPTTPESQSQNPAISRWAAFAVFSSGQYITGHDASARAIVVRQNPWLPATQPEAPLLASIPCDAGILQLAFGPLENLLFATTDDGELLLFDLEEGRQIFHRSALDSPSALSVSGHRLALARDDAPLQVWGAAPASLGEAKILEWEDIAGVKRRGRQLVKVRDADSLPPPPLLLRAADSQLALFWAAYWQAGKAVAKLTDKSTADDLRAAYAPLRTSLPAPTVDEPWQVAQIRARLHRLWPENAAAKTAAAAEEWEPNEREILLREKLLPGEPLARNAAAVRE